MQGFVLTELNVHRVVITSVVLAAKFFDDHYFNNAYYAKVGGVPCSEMNELEVEFLLMINFSLHVCTETYVRYYNELANHYMFTNARDASNMGMPSYQQFRHYVVPDPSQGGQLIYVTDLIPNAHVPTLDETSENNTGTNGMNGMICPKTGRSSGQKRDNAFALGVNA
jgi:hypothetical protein